MQVIGAGFGRTGTLSLKHALETLGYDPCYHMYAAYQDDHMERWRHGDLHVLDGYRATVDWPACTYWRELTAMYPDAYVVLSVRDPDRWWDSFDDTVGEVVRRAHRPARTPWVVALRRFVVEVVEQRSFGRPLDTLTRADVIAAYQAHNAAVIDGVPSRRLLVHDVTDGWAPLCGFLNAPVPDVPFPHVNDREQFHYLHGQHPRDREELAALFAEPHTRTSTCCTGEDQAQPSATAPPSSPSAGADPDRR